MKYQATLASSTHSAYEIALALYKLFKEKYPWHKTVRAITVRAVKLAGEDDEVQLSMFEEEKSDIKRENMEKTAFDLENRFGKGAVTFGSLLTNDKMPFDKEDADEIEVYK